MNAKTKLIAMMALSMAGLISQAAPQNVAKGKAASASGCENEVFQPNLATDGVINRDRPNRQQSRWCSNTMPDSEFVNNIWDASKSSRKIWFSVDLGEVKTDLQDIVIDWEFAKVTDYKLLASEDGVQWKEIYHCTKKSSTPEELISRDEAFSARYIKLEVNKFERQIWPAVSIFEFQVYNGKRPETMNSIANRMNTENIKVLGDKIVLDNIPEGCSAKLIASTFEQVVNLDGSIRRPISDKTTLLTFEVTNGEDVAYTTAIPFTVKGTEAIVDGANAKPVVIPALQEWVGAIGSYQLPAMLNISYDKKLAKDVREDLRDRMIIFAKDYRVMTGKNVEINNDKAAVSVKVVIDEEQQLGPEGYEVEILPEGITITAKNPQGAFWATRTLLQMIKKDGEALPCGKMCDYPQYAVRGMMLDVGRKPFTIEMLYDVMKTMSWYKMSDFQVHLNDCFIWLHDYTKHPNGRNDKATTEASKKAAIKDILDAAPTAFRLESDVVGKDGAKLTASDRFYTKKEFAEFIRVAKKYGVRIVPEFDVPGHALSFVRVRPDLMYRGNVSKNHDVERAAMLDASNDIYDEKTGRTYREETMSFVKQVFDEFLMPQDGEPAVFADAPVVHIGTDEYYGDREDYRGFADELLRYVKSKGYTPRLWGSFDNKWGETPVVSEGVQMHIWSLGWQGPKSSIKSGYHIINILDGHSYIVPNGQGNVGGYGDFLNLKYLYSPSWNPHVMSNQPAIPGHPQLLGAQWAMWNDNSFRRDTGLIEYDLFGRIHDTCSVFAEKTWATGTDLDFETFQNVQKTLALPPRINPYHLVESKTPVVLDMNFNDKKLADKSGNDYHAVKIHNVSQTRAGKEGKALKLKGGNSWVQSAISNIAPNYEVEVWVKRTSDKQTEQVLFSSHTGAFKAVQKDTGRVGITRDTWDYSFNYTLPVNQWVHLKLVANGRDLTLYADGQLIGKPVRNKFPESHRYSSFVFPIEKIGAEENAFEGLVDELKIIKK